MRKRHDKDSETKYLPIPLITVLKTLRPLGPEYPGVLPTEIIQNVFPYLNDFEWFRLRTVCRQFNQIFKIDYNLNPSRETALHVSCDDKIESQEFQKRRFYVAKEDEIMRSLFGKVLLAIVIMYGIGGYLDYHSSASMSNRTDLIIADSFKQFSCPTRNTDDLFFKTFLWCSFCCIARLLIKSKVAWDRTKRMKAPQSDKIAEILNSKEAFLTGRIEDERNYSPRLITPLPPQTPSSQLQTPDPLESPQFPSTPTTPTNPWF